MDGQDTYNVVRNGSQESIELLGRALILLKHVDILNVGSDARPRRRAVAGRRRHARCARRQCEVEVGASRLSWRSGEVQRAVSGLAR